VQPDKYWVGDITYIPTKEGWLYLATVIAGHGFDFLLLKTVRKMVAIPLRGGYFYSERELAVKTKIIFDNLTQGKWRNPIPRFAGNLAQINQLFCERFGE
jgi:hypothetical protein